MMKNRKIRISIRTKIWLAIMAIALTVIAAIWVFEVIFLEDYYIQIKKGDFEKIVTQVTASLEKEGVIGSKDTLYQIAKENTLCIDISRKEGFGVVSYDGLGFNCFIHSNRGNYKSVFDSIKKDGYGIRIANDQQSAKEYYIGTAAATTELEGSKIDAVVIVTQILPPVREAAFVVKNQLMWISIFLIIVSTIMAFLISRSLTKPILKITDATRMLASGAPDVSVKVDSNDEIGDLATNFNYMSKELTKVNRLQRELVANISHDIRTPLTMIKGYAEAIKDITGDDKPTREKQLDIIVDETNRLNVLVNDVMDLSLLQAGQKEIKLASFDICKKAGNILKRYQLLENEGFKFVLEAPESIIVDADEVRIEQVIYNLMNNAVNHIGAEKRITIKISAENDAAKVEIIDTGTGIAKEDLPLIWDRYYKPYKKGQRKEQGTGLGLSIVKAILTAHKSHFGVTSTIGVGSCFWFTLNISKEQEPAE